MASVSGAEIVADARRYLGIPYVFGGGPNNPRAGLDCSGLVERVAFDFHINDCPRTSEAQFIWAIPVDTPSTGDLVFFVGAPEEAGPPGHVAFVIAPGTMLDAPHSGTVVSIQQYSENGTGENSVMGYRRFPGTTPSSSANSSLSDPVVVGAGIVSGVMFFLMLLIVGAVILVGLIVVVKVSSA